MKRNNKIALLLSSALLSIFSAGIYIGAFSYAGYQRTATIPDPTTAADDTLAISGEGTRLKSYYLDLGIWGTISNTGYNFYGLVFQNADHTKFEWILGISDGGNYRYTFDSLKYDRIQFCRMSNEYTPSTFNHRDRTDSDGYSTDLTYELTYSDSYSTYQITGWHGNSFEAVGYWR